MKHEWKKEEKKLYLPKQKPELVEVPRLKYFLISGKGNPNNNPEFGEKIGVLYSLSYAVRMMPKNNFTPEGYFEYTVYPLEGVWDLSEEGIKLDYLSKDEFVYTIMIRQPDFVNEDVVERAFHAVNKKKPNEFLKDVSFDTVEDGLCVQMMHVGPFNDEPRSFLQMKQFIEDNSLERASMTHREIYLSDFRKAQPEKLKTVLRYKVRKYEF